MEKFKYGPLLWNHVDDEDDSGNYWWSGLAPVNYDEMGIPIDKRELQCLPITCPVHPNYEPKHSVFNSALQEHLPSIKEWKEWFDFHFIEISEHRIKREILRWYVKDTDRRTLSKKFRELQSKCNSIDEMVDLVWPLDDDK